MFGDEFTFKTDHTGDTVVVTLAGELDMTTTFRLEPELERVTREADVSELVIDMKDVVFMDSTILGLLLATHQRLRVEGVRFRLANPSKSVRRMLELTGAGDALSVTTLPQRH